MPETFILRSVYTGLGNPAASDILAVHAVIKGRGAVIAGGAARWMDWAAAGGDLAPADIDVFMLAGGNADEVEEAVKTLGYEVARSEDGTVTYHREGHLPVQIVFSGAQEWFRKWATPEELMSEFGFRAEMFALVSVMYGGPSVLTTEAAVSDVLMRRVNVQFIADPIRLAWRYGKYARKGFTMDASEMTRIFERFDGASPELKAKWLGRNLFEVTEGVAYVVDAADYAERQQAEAGAPDTLAEKAPF